MSVSKKRSWHVGAFATLLLVIALLTLWKSRNAVPQSLPQVVEGASPEADERGLSAPPLDLPGPGRLRRSMPEVAVHVRSGWGSPLPDGIEVSIVAREEQEEDAEATRRVCSLPGAVLLDTSGWEGNVRLQVFCEWAVLEKSVVLSPPYPEEVDLVLEPRSKLVVEVLEVGNSRAELSVLREGDEDLGDARDDGRWRFVSEPVRLEFPRLFPGAYRVQLIPRSEVDPLGTPNPRQPGPREQIWVELSAGETKTVAVPDFTSPEIYVSGILSWPGGPLPGHTVSLMVRSTGHHAAATTDSEGRFQMEVIGAGPAELEVRGPKHPSSTVKTRVPVTLPDTSPHVLDVMLAGGVIEGKVVFSEGVSGAIAGRGVTVARLERAPWDRQGCDKTGLPLDEEGGYRLIGLQSGEYRVSVVGPNPFVAPASPGNATTGSCVVRVADGVVRAPDIVVQAPVYVRGQLVREGDDSASQQSGSVAVLVQEEGGRDAWRMIARSEGDGSWESYLAPGRYRVRARGNHPLPLATPSSASWNVMAGGPPLVLDLVPATARAQLLMVDVREGRLLRFTIELREVAGDPLPSLGTWNSWLREHHTGWLVPGSYVFRFQPEIGPAFERTFELAAGKYLEIEILKE